jgi:hypothetical protein
MTDSNNPLEGVSPSGVLSKISAAVPKPTRKNLIIIGSLAVGYHYFGREGKMAVRTKDADCLLAPHAAAVDAGRAITDELMAAGWEMRPDPEFGKPGTPDMPDDDLPVVRLHPPGDPTWFIELLTEPASPTARKKVNHRLSARDGDFALPSFGFLSLTSMRPLETDFGIRYARPEMMALANLLEHPVVGGQTMSAGFAGRAGVKRANKDLGRVIAIARLAACVDEDALLEWSAEWREALEDRFGDEWRKLASRAGNGLRELLDSPADLEEAHFTCVNGLLAGAPPTMAAFEIAGRRLLTDAIEPLERTAAE